MSVVTETVAGVPIRLTGPFDLSFIHQYGTVFKVFDGFEGSCNLHFGVEHGGKKYFIKFAGAPKEKFDFGTTEDAIAWLKDAEQVYRDLSHENLVKLVRGEEIGGGYALVFEWTDAQCIGRRFPKSRKKFLRLPMGAKLRAYDDILRFHAHAAGKGYVAIDFYHDQIMYDFANGRAIICDIDFYQKSPYFGDKGPWGSTLFVSPEERTPGARIDEVTMVYTMGATAFSIFSDHDRSYKKWPLGKPLYDVVARATSDDRGMRQPSIRELIREWNENIGYWRAI